MPKININRPKHIVSLDAVQAMTGNGTNEEMAEILGMSVTWYSQIKSQGRELKLSNIKKLVELSGGKFSIEDFLLDD